LPVDALECNISPLTDAAMLSTRWRALEARTSGPFFLTWDWMGPWLSLVRSPLYLCHIRRGDEDVALAIIGTQQKRHGPLKFQTVYLNQSGEPEEDQVFIEYNDFLCAETHRAEVWSCFLEHLTIGRARLPASLKHWVLLRLSGLERDGFERQSGRRLITFDRHDDQAYLIDLESARSSPDGYLGTLSANTRRQILRSREILGGDGNLSFQVAATAEQVDDWLSSMTALQCAWFEAKGQTAALSRPFFSQFVRRLIFENLTSGSVELIQCRSDDSPVGYLLNLKSDDHVYSYQSAFVQYDDNKIKPGLMCHAMLAENYAAQGMAFYNLLAGDSQYKKSLSNKSHSLHWTSLAVPSARVSAFIQLRRWLRR